MSNEKAPDKSGANSRRLQAINYLMAIRAVFTMLPLETRTR